jgi:hypothetical protein
MEGTKDWRLMHHQDNRCYCEVPLWLQGGECGNCGGIITMSNRDKNGHPYSR